MKQEKSAPRPPTFRPVYLSALVAVMFLGKAVIFAAAHGAIEHDSGWYLGVARNLAQRGIYASYTNTTRSDAPAIASSIHGRLSVQDKDGFVYFPAGVTVGPGFIVLEALFLRFFGAGYWSFRFLPLVAFVGLIFLCLEIASALGGMPAQALLAFWLWLLPRFYLGLAYEAFSEPLALLYLLAAAVLIFPVDKKESSFRRCALSGVLLGLSILTKQLFLLAGLVLAGALVWEWALDRSSKNLRRLFWFGAGCTIPIATFELYRFFFLTSQFGLSAWIANIQEIAQVYRSGGSGIGFSIDPQRVLAKANVFRSLGLGAPVITWNLVLLLGILFFAETPSLAWVLWGVLAIYSGWFVFLTDSSFSRHFWHAMVLFVLLVSIAAAKAISQLKLRGKNARPSCWVFVWLFGVQLLMLRPDVFSLGLRFTYPETLRWYVESRAPRLDLFPHGPIFSLADQKEMTEVFKRRVHPEDHVYYYRGLLVTELPPLVDHVFRPLAARVPRPNDYLVLGPYQMGTWPWRIASPAETNALIEKTCKKVVFQNPSYLLCQI